jgi:hypothetical protein
MAFPILPMWAKIVACVAAFSVFVVGKFYFKLSDSNPVELMAEEVIKEETGVDVVALEKDVAANQTLV